MGFLSASSTVVRFIAEPFTPDQPGDEKYGGRRIPGVRMEVTARERLQASRVGAAILWALHKVHPDSLQLRATTFDLRMGADEIREALLGGTDPDVVIDREIGMVVSWQQRVRKYLLYR